MNSTVKRYAFRLSQLSEVMGGRLEVVEYTGDGLPYVLAADYDALEAECEMLRAGKQLLIGDLERRDATVEALEAERDKLVRVLGNVEREHELIRQMKNCEIQRGRGSFGIGVMSDPPALEWQALDKELQQLIDARHAAFAASTGQEVEK